MTKKHYIEFAKLIKSSNRFNHSKDRFIKDLIRYFEIQNPKFNKDRFLKASDLR